MYTAQKRLADTGYVLSLLYCGEENWYGMTVAKRAADGESWLGSVETPTEFFERTPRWSWWRRLIWGYPPEAPSHAQQLKKRVVELIAECEAKIAREAERERTAQELYEQQTSYVNSALAEIGFSEEWTPELSARGRLVAPAATIAEVSSVLDFS